MSLLPVDNGLTDDHKRALQALAHIALGSMSHTIERYAANDLLNYMGELERQRTEARDALTAREIDLSERTSQRDAWRERAFKAETSLTARDKALDAANKLWRLCVDEGWPWADGETQDALTELGLLVPRDMKAADAGEPCESCYGDCDTCYQAIDKLEDLK